MSMELVQKAVVNVRPSGSDSVEGELSFNTLIQGFIGNNFKVVRSVLQNPYIIVYVDIPTDLLIQNTDNNNTLKNIVVNAQTKITLRISELIKLLQTGSDMVEFKDMKQNGDDVLLVVNVKVPKSGGGEKSETENKGKSETENW